MYSVTVAGALLPAIETSELADFIAVPTSDTTLPIVALMATGMAVEFLQSELRTRRRTLIYPEWPVIGTPTFPSLSKQNYGGQFVIDLPYAQLVSVEEVELYGESTTDYEIRPTKQAAIILPPNILTGPEPAIKVVYDAGFGAAVADVPRPIQLGILMLAAFLYEHRGSCDADQALKRSGAYQQLYPHKIGDML